MLTTYALPVLPRPCPRTLIEKTPDEALIKAIAIGDRQAMATLFARHNVRVYRFIARLTRNAALAEDVPTSPEGAVGKVRGCPIGRLMGQPDRAH